MTDDDDDRQVSQEGVRRADIPADLHERFQAVTTRRLHRQRALVHCWVVGAAHLAEHARTDPRLLDPAVLPPARTLPTIQGPKSRVRWLMDDEEYARCFAAITGVGSSVTAVIRVNIALYVAADGNLLDLPLRWA